MRNIYQKRQFGLGMLLLLVATVPVVIAAVCGTFGGFLRVVAIGALIVGGVLAVSGPGTMALKGFFCVIADSTIISRRIERSFHIALILLLLSFSYLGGRFSLRAQIERLRAETRNLRDEKFYLNETITELKTTNSELRRILDQFRPLEEGMKADAWERQTGEETGSRLNGT